MPTSDVSASEQSRSSASVERAVFISHCTILEIGREACDQAVALGITRPLHATGSTENHKKGLKAGADPASIVRRAISVIFGSQDP